MLAKEFRLPTQALLEKKPWNFKTRYFLFRISPSNLSYSRFGIIAKKEIVKKATARNAARRAIFDLIRREKFHLVPGHNVSITLLKEAAELGRAELDKEIKISLEKIFHNV